jgi:hypothetical protein
MASRNSAAKTRGKPFKPGNPGKPRGARNKATMAVATLLEGEKEALTRKAIERALDGDVTALRLCLDRISPVKKDSPVAFTLPTMETADDAAKAAGAILEAVAAGDLTPTEGTAVAGLIETFRRTLETTEIERRIAALEKEQPQ